MPNTCWMKCAAQRDKPITLHYENRFRSCIAQENIEITNILPSQSYNLCALQNIEEWWFNKQCFQFVILYLMIQPLNNLLYDLICSCMFMFARSVFLTITIVKFVSLVSSVLLSDDGGVAKKYLFHLCCVLN